MILASISIGVFIFLFFHTDFIGAYLKLFRLDWLVKDYLEWHRHNPDYFLPHFLREEVKGGRIISFIVSLLGCPICLAIFTALWTGKFFLVCGGLSLVTYFLLAILYKILNTSEYK